MKVLPGSEHLLPAAFSWDSEMGITHYGKQMLHGVSCYKIAIRDVDRAKSIGYSVCALKTVYGYVYKEVKA